MEQGAHPPKPLSIMWRERSELLLLRKSITTIKAASGMVSFFFSSSSLFFVLLVCSRNLNMESLVDKDSPQAIESILVEEDLERVRHFGVD